MERLSDRRANFNFSETPLVHQKCKGSAIEGRRQEFDFPLGRMLLEGIMSRMRQLQTLQHFLLTFGRIRRALLVHSL